MASQEQILNILRTSKVYSNDLKKYVEKNIKDNFGYCFRKNLSINEWKPDSVFIDEKTKNGRNQKTVFISARTFDLWEDGLIECFNNYCSSKKIDIKFKPAYSNKADIKILGNGELLMKWEVKTSLAEDKWTGVTHGKNKCNNYILINLKLDLDMKLGNKYNKNFVQKMFVVVWNDINPLQWRGIPTNNSSFTTLQLGVEDINKNPEIVVLGKAIKKTKWCRFEMEDVTIKDFKLSNLFFKKKNGNIKV